VVHAVAQSCNKTFANDDGFLRSAFQPQLDQLVRECDKAPDFGNGPPTPITAPFAQAMQISACGGGTITDGSGSGYPPSATGTDAVVINAPPDKMVVVTVVSTQAIIRWINQASEWLGSIKRRNVLLKDCL